MIENIDDVTSVDVETNTVADYVDDSVTSVDVETNTVDVETNTVDVLDAVGVDRVADTSRAVFCPICFDKINDNDVIVFGCNHKVCTGCTIEMILHNKFKTCPMCRCIIILPPQYTNINNLVETFKNKTHPLTLLYADTITDYPFDAEEGYRWDYDAGVEDIDGENGGLGGAPVVDGDEPSCVDELCSEYNNNFKKCVSDIICICIVITFAFFLLLRQN